MTLPLEPNPDQAVLELPDTLQPNEIYVIWVTEHKSYWVRNPEYDPYELHGFGGPPSQLIGGASDTYWYTSTRSEQALARLTKQLAGQIAKFAWHDAEKKKQAQGYDTFEQWATYKIKKEKYTDK